MKISAYAVSAAHLEESYDKILESCRRQAIGKIAITASMTGKLMGEPEAMLRMRRRLEGDGIAVFGMIYAIGHPAMDKYYGGRDTPPDPIPFYTGGLVAADWQTAGPLPRSWRYAVNEFGNPVFCCACPDDACMKGNVNIMRALAEVFDEIWYDDDYRVDGDQGAGNAAGSTASCYCDRCMAELSERVGRTVRRVDVMNSAELHGEWIRMKVDRLTALWEAVGNIGRSVNPKLKLGLMVRWGGEERDGIDLDQLFPSFKGDVRVRAGEGHFGPNEYSDPQGPVLSYLSVSHHVGWLPPSVEVLSETTYFKGIRHEDIRKKIALALAAGVKEISYCPCVDGWIRHQDFLEADLPEIRQWSAAFGDRSRLVNPVVILRTPAAGFGSSDPVKRAADRQIFPWFNLAGIGTVVTRSPGQVPPGGARVVAVMGRAVLDTPHEWLEGSTVVLDGSALLHDSQLRRSLGVDNVVEGDGGIVTFESATEWTRDGSLFTKPGWIIVPCVWHSTPPETRDAVLGAIRRVIAPLAGAPTLSGDFDVFLACAEQDDGTRALMIVNLTRKLRRVSVRLPEEGESLATWDGAPAPASQTLAPDEIRVLKVLPASSTMLTEI